jgi:hypothetical protein
MSKRCELQKEYYQAKGNYKGNGKYNDDYVRWLEDQILALRIHDVVGRSEQLKAFMDFALWYKDEYKQHIPLGAIKEYVKSL